MLRPLTQNLCLPASGLDVSQPVPMGTHNAVNVHAWVDEAGGSLSTAGEVILQGSDDMDNWEDISGYSIQIDQAPLSKQYPDLYANVISSAFVRLKFVGGGSKIVISATINLLTI